MEEIKPPYGYVGTTDSYDVTFVWDNQLYDVVMAKSIIKNGDSEQHFDVVSASEASAELAEQQTLGFYNDREHARVGVYKINQETGKYLAGAVFNLYTRDDIYDVDGNKLFSAGDLISTSPETVADGYTYFNCDVPIRGEWYGQSDRLDATTNSGNYFIRELRAPQGYYLNDAEMEVTFTYDSEVLQVLDSTCANKPTEMWVSKRDLTNDEELPGATLIIKDAKGDIVDTWVSTDTPHRVTGLHFDEEYTLTEMRPADGYAVADDIVFRLERKTDADGHQLDEADVYYLKDKKKLWIIPWEEWELLDDATVIMKDDITRVQISKVDIATGKELPGAELVIKDKDGNTVAQWVSEDKPNYIEKLPAGDYTLTETAAPAGYLLSEEVHFTVQETGEIQKVTMYDAPAHSLILTKRDIVTNAKLADARLTIRDAYGTTIDRWTTTDGDHAIRVLPERSAAKDPHKNLLLLSDDTSEHVYTMVEELAPDGYLVAESITFKVMQMNDALVVFIWQDGGWQKSSEGYLAIYDERTDTPVPLMKTFPQTGSVL